MNLKTKFLGVNKIEKNFSLGTLILQLFFPAKVLEHNGFLIYDGMQLDMCAVTATIFYFVCQLLLPNSAAILSQDRNMQLGNA